MPTAEDIQRASSSFAFQKMLQLNPKLARAAARDRARIALEYLRARPSSPVAAASALSPLYPDPRLVPTGESIID